MLSILGISAMQVLGTPYRFGGFDANGLDCSALVVKSFRHIGYPMHNMNSMQQYLWATDLDGAYSCLPQTDCLLFYGRKNNKELLISHVAIALNDKILIEAGGAGRDSLELTREQLLAREAMVRIRPINHRSDLVASIKIPLSKL